MSFLYPIKPQEAPWSLRDYGVHVFRVAMAPLVSLVAVPFFLLKGVKNYLTPSVDPLRFAALQNEVSRDCRKIRFYAKRLIPLIGYYWGHRNKERIEKYSEINSLSHEQLQVLALKRTQANKRKEGKEPPLFRRGEKLTWMIRACSSDEQRIEAVLQGVIETPFKNSVLPYILGKLLAVPEERELVVQILQFLKKKNFDLLTILSSVPQAHRADLLQLWQSVSLK